MGLPKDTPQLVGGAVAVSAIVGVIAVAVSLDRHERALIASGHCRALTEQLYTPPPMVQTQCSGSGQSLSCFTYTIPMAPYFRTLWRCVDPDKGGAQTEFWRRSTDEATP